VVKLKIIKISLVIGLYKSGTSLLTKVIEDNGSSNPSSITNPCEAGYATNGQRYNTRECSVARAINITLSRPQIKLSSYEKMIKGYIELVTLSNGNNIVIKSPHFLRTLPFWCTSLGGANYDLSLHFTDRANGPLLKAWKNAPWTSAMLDENPSVIDDMRRAQNELLSKYSCHNDKLIVYPFDELG